MASCASCQPSCARASSIVLGIATHVMRMNFSAAATSDARPMTIVQSSRSSVFFLHQAPNRGLGTGHRPPRSVDLRELLDRQRLLVEGKPVFKLPHGVTPHGRVSPLALVQRQQRGVCPGLKLQLPLLRYLRPLLIRRDLFRFRCH